MRGYIRSVRPAGAAIAAVLALSSTHVFAQEAAAPAPADTVVVPPPAVNPAFSPAQPVVQPTPSVEERLNAAVAASQAEAADQQAAPAPAAESRARRERQTSARTAATPAPRRQTAAAVAERTQAVPPVARTQETAPAPVAVQAERPAAPAVAARVEDDARGNDQALFWALGGSALLLLGLGGAAVLPRRRDQVAVDELAPAVTGPASPKPMIAEPASMPEPRPYRAPVTAPAAAMPQGTSLGAMVAAPPSPENPFRTYRKRMTRAKFLLAQQERREAAQRSPASAPVPPQTIQAEPQMQTVFRLGGNRSRQMDFKPQTR